MSDHHQERGPDYKYYLFAHLLKEPDIISVVIICEIHDTLLSITEDPGQPQVPIGHTSWLGTLASPVLGWHGSLEKIVTRIMVGYGYTCHYNCANGGES